MYAIQNIFKEVVSNRKELIEILRYVCCDSHSLRNVCAGKGCISRLVHSCFVGHCETGLLDSPPYTPNASTHAQRTFTQDALLLMYCFFGLQISYLTWGYLQEKIMTQVCLEYKYFTNICKLLSISLSKRMLFMLLFHH